MITCIDKLVPGKWDCNFKSVIFKLILQINILNPSLEIAHGRAPQNPIDDRSTMLPDGTKPVSEPVLTKFHDAKWRH